MLSLTVFLIGNVHGFVTHAFELTITNGGKLSSCGGSHLSKELLLVVFGSRRMRHFNFPVRVGRKRPTFGFERELVVNFKKGLIDFAGLEKFFSQLVSIFRNGLRLDVPRFDERGDRGACRLSRNTNHKVPLVLLHQPV